MKDRLQLLVAGLLTPGSRVVACEMCTAQQPSLLRGLSHDGAVPTGGLDYLIVFATTALALFALFWAVKCLLRPGEDHPAHIKRIVLHPDYDGTQGHG